MTIKLIFAIILCAFGLGMLLSTLLFAILSLLSHFERSFEWVMGSSKLHSKWRMFLKAAKAGKIDTNPLNPNEHTYKQTYTIIKDASTELVDVYFGSSVILSGVDMPKISHKVYEVLNQRKVF